MAEKEISNQVENLDDISMEGKKPTEEKKKHPALKFIAYFSIIILATSIALFLSLYQDFDGVINSIARADVLYLLLIFGLVVLSYSIEAFVIFVFVRLYTRKYYYHQAFATQMVGSFYSAVTPGASGGQAMEVYTMKKQGVEVSNAASIMIMSFIIYQSALIVVGIIGVIFKWDLITTIGNFEITIGGALIAIPAIPFTIAGFLLNISVILLLFVMSFSHKFHNFIMHHGINFLAKLRILKKPEQTRESLRIQVENFKIELKRLGSNIPVTILIFICFALVLIIRFSIPYFAGIALDGYGYLQNLDGTLYIDSFGNAVLSTGQVDFASFWNAVFLSSYHQMVAGLVPIPGAAGVSEYFFNMIFSKFFMSQQVTSAAQIIWRFMTYHIVILCSGIIAASYHVTPKEGAQHANRKTFVTIQFETYEIRKASADTMYETASLSRKELQEKLRNFKPQTRKNKGTSDDVIETKPAEKRSLKKKPIKESNKKTTLKTKSTNIKSKNKKKKVTSDDGWDDISIGDE